MKRSEFGKVVTLLKAYLEEETAMGFDEIIREPLATPAAGAAAAPRTLEETKAAVGQCRKCPLSATRIQPVFGTGNPRAALMFIGEGPGYDEDRQGEPFVGKAGQLLTKIIESIGFTREEVYIANVVKCHPLVDPSDREKRGNDRPPAPEEIASCLPYLEEQIALINPEIICTLGNIAARALLHADLSVGKIRGKWHEYRGIRLMPTYHPAALLRNEALKKDVWTDMKKIRAELKGSE